MGQNQLIIAILGPKNFQLGPKLAKTCIWVVLMDSKNLAQKSKKLAFFWPKKGIFWPVTEKENGTPTLHENRIRGLENASIDLKIGINVPWVSRKKVTGPDFGFLDFFQF